MKRTIVLAALLMAGFTAASEMPTSTVIPAGRPQGRARRP